LPDCCWSDCHRRRIDADHAGHAPARSLQPSERSPIADSAAQIDDRISHGQIPRRADAEIVNGEISDQPPLKNRVGKQWNVPL
jgi:hypothetical protein